MVVDGDDVARLEQSLVHAARRNREGERFLVHDGAEVAAGPERPAALVAVPADFRQVFGECLETQAAEPPPSSSEHPPRRAGHRGVSENPWTVSSNPRSLRATVVILERQTSASGCRRSVTSRASDNSGANTAFAGAVAAFQVYATARQPVASNRKRFSRSLPCSTTVTESSFRETRALIGTAAHDWMDVYRAFA